MEKMTVITPVDIQMRKFDKSTAIKTFTFHAIGNAEAMNTCQSATASSAYNCAFNSALYDNPACGLVPATFLNKLLEAFDNFMCVDAVTDVCSRLYMDNDKISFK